MSFIYLASPYSDPDANRMHKRYLIVKQVVAELIAEGIIIYSPILHFHQLALDHELPKDNKFWQRHNMAMLRAASNLCVLRLPEWQASKGCALEIAFAEAQGIPILWRDPP